MAPVKEARQNQHSSILLGVDRAGSVLTIQNDHQRNNRSYTVYGDKPSVTPEACKTGFVGELLEAFGDHYILGNGVRAYAQTLMRFRSPDALAPFGAGGINSFMYCSGNPVNFIDRTGRMHEPLSLQQLAHRMVNYLSLQPSQRKAYNKTDNEMYLKRRRGIAPFQSASRQTSHMDPKSFAKYWRGRPPEELDLGKAVSWVNIYMIRPRITERFDHRPPLNLQHGASPETGDFFGFKVTGVFPEHLELAIKIFGESIPKAQKLVQNDTTTLPLTLNMQISGETSEFASYSYDQYDSHMNKYLDNLRQKNLKLSGSVAISAHSRHDVSTPVQHGTDEYYRGSLNK